MREKLGDGIQKGIKNYFSEYDFTAKTWAGLTNSEPAPPRTGNVSAYQGDGSGIIRRGAARYQVLVPSYTVTFAFFLVLTTGWLFVAERRHGTMARLRAAPIARWQILLGKVIPCLVVSLFQGAFLLLAGRLVFGMNWGPMPELLIPGRDLHIARGRGIVGISRRRLPHGNPGRRLRHIVGARISRRQRIIDAPRPDARRNAPVQQSHAARLGIRSLRAVTGQPRTTTGPRVAIVCRVGRVRRCVFWFSVVADAVGLNRNPKLWYHPNMATETLPTTIDLAGLPAPVVQDLQRLVETLRGRLSVPNDVPQERRPLLRGRFERPGLGIPKEMIDEAQRELWANFPRDLPETKSP